LKSFSVVGGDLRYIELATFLSRDKNKRVFAMGFDKNVFTAADVKLVNSSSREENRADYIILPIPAAKDDNHVNANFYTGDIPMKSLPQLLHEGGTVFAGRMTPAHKKLFEDKGISVIDYSEREDFAVMNAVATAEGAVQIAMEETDETLSSQKILILGMGRIAKVLIKQLVGFSTDITAAARKPQDLEWAKIFGGKGLTLSKVFENLSEYDLVFNTIPAMILDETKLIKMKKSAVIIDLASKPGGVDFEAAARLGIKANHALSLPGKVAPVTSGEVIAKTIANILIERGEDYE
jgi:dipicolinate synthase subunit A